MVDSERKNEFHGSIANYNLYTIKFVWKKSRYISWKWHIIHYWRMNVLDRSHVQHDKYDMTLLLEYRLINEKNNC